MSPADTYPYALFGRCRLVSHDQEAVIKEIWTTAYFEYLWARLRFNCEINRPLRQI